MGKSLRNYLAFSRKFSPGMKRRVPATVDTKHPERCPKHDDFKHESCMGPSCRLYDSSGGIEMTEFRPRGVLFRMSPIAVLHLHITLVSGRIDADPNDVAADIAMVDARPAATSAFGAGGITGGVVVTMDTGDRSDHLAGPTAHTSPEAPASDTRSLHRHTQPRSTDAIALGVASSHASPQPRFTAAIGGGSSTAGPAKQLRRLPSDFTQTRLAAKALYNKSLTVPLVHAYHTISLVYSQ